MACLKAAFAAVALQTAEQDQYDDAHPYGKNCQHDNQLRPIHSRFTLHLNYKKHGQEFKMGYLFGRSAWGGTVTQ